MAVINALKMLLHISATAKAAALEGTHQIWENAEFLKSI
jgi:hypothetical protein